MKVTFFVGRIILGLFFLQAAFNHFSNLSMLAGYATSKGVPMPEISVFITGLLLLFGALSILLGYKPTLGVIALVIFFIPVTFMMHAFWNDADKMAQMNDMVSFGKNLAIMGATLMLTAIPTPWPMSLESRKKSKTA